MAAASHDNLHGLTVEEITLLSQEVQKAKSNAYCPYSKFQVGCTILLKQPVQQQHHHQEVRTISGANVENAAYPVGTCAERVAFGTAVASGLRHGAFKAIAVAADTTEACSPCGMCRQFLREFCELKMPVFMFTKEEGRYVVMTLEQLLPLSFGPEDLVKHAAEAQKS